MTKLLLAGDTHSDMRHLQKLCMKARQFGAEAIVQLGDFGFVWSYGDDFTKVENVVSQFGLHLYFILGNHENYDRLAELGVDHTASEMQHVTEHVTHLPRGFAWDVDGVRFMALGGAFSIDKGHRKPNTEWWPEETITDADVNRSIANGKVDVLLTHDAPQLPHALEMYMTSNGMVLAMGGHGYKIDSASRSNRLAVTAVMQAVDPFLLVHGHFHHAYHDILANTVVRGLGMNGSGSDSWFILDTDTIKAEVADLYGRLSK